MSARDNHICLSRRRGFTLVELLVVMAIIAVLASIGLYAFNPFQSQSSVNNGAVLLQSWLNSARQNALRAQAPRGLRLLAGDEIFNDSGATVPRYVTKCVFIEQQEDVVGTGIHHTNFNGNSKALKAPGTSSANVSSGDFVEINGGTLHQIASISGDTLNLATDFPYNVAQSGNATFRIHRTPTTVVSSNVADTDEVLRLPRGAVINLQANEDFWNLTGVTPQPGHRLNPSTPSVAAPLDIIFNPDGTVRTPALHDDKIILWVTASKKNLAGVIDPRQGVPSLVVIYTRSGLIAGYPVDRDWDSASKSWKAVNPYQKVP